jgi:hypothetical protein
MKKINEKWVEFEYKAAGNIYDPSFYPTKTHDIKKMVAKLNQIYLRKRKKK